jgi:hypothetical protein
VKIHICVLYQINTKIDILFQNIKILRGALGFSEELVCDMVLEKF